MFNVSFLVSAQKLEQLLNATHVAGLPRPGIEHIRNPTTRHAPKPVEEKPVGAKRGKYKTKARQGALNDQVLAMTGKKATAGSIRSKLMAVFEQLEVKNGLGSVTRKNLRDAARATSLDPQIVGQLVQDGYLTGE